jgi:glycosyltransferase involved in cell wall biosynthesis
MQIAIVTSIHPDFDSRIWKHATATAAAGLDVSLICPWAVEPGERRDGVTFWPFPRASGRWQRLAAVPWRVLATLKPRLADYDVVHFHDIDLLPWMALLARRIAVVYDVHENYPDEMLVRHWVPGPLRRPLYHGVRVTQRALARRVGNLVLVVPFQDADFDLERCRRIFLYNYASDKLADQVSNDYGARQPVVVFPGSQNRQTGTLVLLQAAEILAARRPAVEFHLSDRFSSPAFRAEVLTKIEQAGLAGRVKLIPPVHSDDIMSVLNQGRIGVVPSLRLNQQMKGRPRKLFEYMAAGLPVVASDLPFLQETLKQHRCGLLARPEEPETFAAAIEQLIDDPRAAEVMGQAGRAAFAAHFSFESQIPGLVSFYEGIVASREGRSAS